MDNRPDLEAELASLRRQLAEATANAGVHKKQLADAKAKAKAVIQRKMNEADAKVNLLEEQNKLQAEELATLKPMLRQIDDQRSNLSEQCENLELQLHQLHSQNTHLQTQCSSLERDLTDARHSASQSATTSKEKAADLQSEVDTLRSQLQELNQAREATEANQPAIAVVPNGLDISKLEKELSDAKQSIEQLVTQRDQLRTENQSLKKGADEESSGSERELTESPSKVGALWEETRKSKERVEVLSRQLEEATADAETTKSEYEKGIREAEAEKVSLTEEITKSKQRINDLLEDLQKSEIALQQEREKVIDERKSKSESVTQEGQEKTKMLEAKVSEMERVVASKQAEIGKVREKARTYLRELNAEKRAMETKMKEEVDSLQTEVEEERKKVEAAERRAEAASMEVDNCLALIRDKQKSVQMLKMTISSQKSAATEAERESDSLREEFSRYKERARLALREKDTAVESVEFKIEEATVGLRKDLETSQKESSHLKTRLRQFEEVQKRYAEVLERAERAEAAADLLRKDANGVSNTDFSRVDALEEKLSNMEGELSAARDAVEDAEAKLETSRMRLEAAEKALRVEEVRAEEMERISQKTIEGQRSRLEVLDKELAKARESAASAQRTAAAAAKALAVSSSESGAGDQEPSPKPAASLDNEIRPMSNVLSFGSPSPIKGGRATLAAAMAGHADRFGLQASIESESGSSQALDSELKMKDQQIMLLTSQIAELGALLDDVQHEADLRSKQTSLLKEEVKNLDAQLAAAEKLQNGAPFSYLRTIVVRYLETDDVTLLPVIANVLSFTKEENLRVKARRGANATPGASPKGGYFGLNGLLGSRR